LLEQSFMEFTPPDWLTRRGGALRKCPDGRSWAVLINGGPQYLLVPFPVAGKYGCVVEQTVNGKRLESKNTYASEDEAVRGGLEDLRKALGW
jgi:hypothetical protein